MAHRGNFFFFPLPISTANDLAGIFWSRIVFSENHIHTLTKFLKKWSKNFEFKFFFCCFAERDSKENAEKTVDQLRKQKKCLVRILDKFYFGEPLCETQQQNC